MDQNKRGISGRTILAALFLAAGAMHFAIPGIYLRIMPPYLPQPLLLVYISGIVELLSGIGLLIPATRHAAAWCLVVLLIAVWPANVYMGYGASRLPWHYGAKLGSVVARASSDPVNLLGMVQYP